MSDDIAAPESLCIGGPLDGRMTPFRGQQISWRTRSLHGDEDCLVYQAMCLSVDGRQFFVYVHGEAPSPEEAVWRLRDAGLLPKN